MAEEDKITFSQSDLPCIGFASLEDMRKRGHLCDLTIKVQNHSFSAHRVILAAVIPYFESVLSNSATQTRETEIAVEELDPLALQSLIQFAYTSKIEISIKNVQSLLVTSQFLQLNQVRDACAEFLSQRLQIDDVIRVRTVAWSLNNVHLLESCNRFIQKNFERFSKCDDFLNLSQSCIKEMISADDLNVSSEEIVFEALMKWVKSSPDERLTALPELLCEVRMIYLPMHYICNAVETDDLIVSSKVCRNLVKEVKNYLLLTERGMEFFNLKRRPRNPLNFDLYGICRCNTCGYSVHHFDFAKEVWCVLASNQAEWKSIKAVAEFNSIKAAVVNSIIYMFLQRTIQTFHLKTHKWEVLEQKHEDFEGAAIVSNGNCIYCFGSANTVFREKVRCFDTQLNEWVQQRKVKTWRSYHAAASLTDTIYVTGGRNITPINTVEKYSTLTDQWDDVTPMLASRCCHGCCSMNGRVYTCGGLNEAYKKLSTAEVYDTQTEQWNLISCMNNPVSYVSLVSHCHKLYVLHKTAVEVYDPKKNEWKCAYSVPVGFQRAVSGPSISSKNDPI